MTYNAISPVKKFFLALTISFITVPFSRLISPETLIDGNIIYLAWLPLSVIISVIMLFGRHGLLPLVLAFALTNTWMLPMKFLQSGILLFCQLFAAFVSCGILRWTVGKRWRFGLPNKRPGLRIFWIGFFAPVLMKMTMFFAGWFLDFPQWASVFFVYSSVVYRVVDIQSLFCAALIFTTLFYYPLRMILNPHYGRRFWKGHIQPLFSRSQRFFTSGWLAGVTALLILLCGPFRFHYIAGYLVPVIFILFFIAINRFSYPLISLLWGISAFFLVACNQNFLHGVSTEYALSFVLSVLISFTICMLYISQIYARSNKIKRKWRSQALQDPLTGLPNLRAFEDYLAEFPDASVCCLRMGQLEFLSRHYGMMMRVYCKKSVASELQPLLGNDEKLFQLPGSELLLVLHGNETMDRLTFMVNLLNSRKFIWQNNPLELEFGASWGKIEREDDNLHPMLGQLCWLSEQACPERRVMALDASQETVSDNTTERVMLLGRVKKALAGGGLKLFAQAIVNEADERHYEILARLVCDGETIPPDHFLPVLEQFNLNIRFDLQVVECLFQQMKQLPGHCFSVNLMPYTIMQKESASKIIALFEKYQVSPSLITIEITEQQAFSGTEMSLQNICRLREYGCRIAIDDFGTGYANFERLKRLEADIVKIDGCFIRDIVREPADEMIVKAICDLARVKKLTVIAEYVETQAQRDLLFRLGVDYLQGYLIGKPQPLSDLKV